MSHFSVSSVPIKLHAPLDNKIIGYHSMMHGQRHREGLTRGTLVYHALLGLIEDFLMEAHS